MEPKVTCEIEGDTIVVRITRRVFTCALCGATQASGAPARIDPFNGSLAHITAFPPPGWEHVNGVGFKECPTICPTCAKPIAVARDLARQLEERARRALIDRIRAQVFPPRADRAANQKYAQTNGFAWRQCPRCDKWYGTHEEYGDPVPCLRNERWSHTACCDRVSPADDARACVRAHELSNTP